MIQSEDDRSLAMKSNLSLGRKLLVARKNKRDAAIDESSMYSTGALKSESSEVRQKERLGDLRNEVSYRLTAAPSL